MSTFALVLTAFGLAVDCVAVAASRGMVARRVRTIDAVTVGAWFGGLHGAMMIAGASLGAHVAALLHPWDHWVAFALLAGVAAHALWEAREPAMDAPVVNPFRWWMMLPLAVATSIDAFAVGVTLPLVGAPVVTAAILVGLVVLVLSAAGALIGRGLGSATGRALHVVGGLVLLGLAVKLLIEGLRE